MAPRFVVTEPTVVRLEGLDERSLTSARSFLTFQDRGVAYLVSQHKKKFAWKSNDPEGWLQHNEELKSHLKRCILFEDEKGLWTYSGLVDALRGFMREAVVENGIVRPTPAGIAWAKPPVFEDRYYQTEAENALVAAGHGAIEMGTGLGKSTVLRNLCHRLGLHAIIIAPSSSILSQLMVDFTRAFGSRYVGQYGDGKKKCDRLFTIATYQSLTRIEPGSEQWDRLSDAEVFIVDESHMCPAGTLEKVCMGLARQASYRFFVSATQTRGDGSELVLKGITGPIVYSMSVQRGVDEGFLAKPHFKMVQVRSSDTFESADVQKMTRHHLFYNDDVIRRAADIANMAVERLGHRVLIQVEELPQFAKLLPHLRHEARFAHGTPKSDPAMKAKLPKEYWDSDPQQLVEQFNDEQFSILVGTSCIGTGTDFKVPETVINMMGGASAVSIPQAVGRGTRRHTFKDGRKKASFNFVDFAVMLNTKKYADRPGEQQGQSLSPLYRHALNRSQLYRDLYPNLAFI